MQETEIDPYTPPAPEDPPPPRLPQRPKRVLVIGCLFCAAGGISLVDLIWRIFSDSPHLSLAVLMLPVGIGLLRGRTSSQWWATLWLIFGYGVCVVMVVAEWLWPGQTNIEAFGYRFDGGYPMPLLILCCIIPAAFLITLHMLISSRKSLAWFREIRIQELRERLSPRRARHRPRPTGSLPKP